MVTQGEGKNHSRENKNNFSEEGINTGSTIKDDRGKERDSKGP